MFLCLQSENRTVKPLDNAILGPQQKGSLSEVQCEHNAHLFFDAKGTVHSEFVPIGQTTNQVFYTEVHLVSQEVTNQCAEKISHTVVVW